MNDLQLANASPLCLHQYRAGDLVRLKIGGPLMVVLAYAAGQGESRAVCIWFKTDGALCEAAFPEEVLVDCDTEPMTLFEGNGSELN